MSVQLSAGTSTDSDGCVTINEISIMPGKTIASVGFEENRDITINGNLNVHGSITSSIDDHHHYGLDASDNTYHWSSADAYTLSGGWSSGAYTWNKPSIELITYHDDGKISVHQKLVDAILSMILENKDLADQLLSKLMERVLQKGKKFKVTPAEREKIFR